MALQSTTALATVTLQAAAPSVTFSGIPNTYRDLLLTANGAVSSGQGIYLYLNGDTTAGNYSRITMYGDGSSYASGAASDAKSLDMYTSTTLLTINIFDYSTTNKHKTILNRVDAASSITEAVAARWANTNAVSSVTIQTQTGTFNAGSTFSLYGRIA